MSGPHRNRALWASGAVVAAAMAAGAAWHMASTPGARKAAPGPTSTAAAPAPRAPVDPRVLDHFNRELPVPADFDSPRMRQLKRTALAGDAGAAFQLFLFYSACTLHNKFLGRAPGRPDTPECLRADKAWLRIAAENGHSGAQMMLGSKARESTQCEQVYRARFWYKKARQQGFVPIYVPNEEEMSAKERSCHWGGEVGETDAR